MEALNDDELKQALRQWKAPNAPASLERKVMPREAWWRWLITGSVRTAVPALIAVATVALAVYTAFGEKPIPDPVKPTVSLSDFEPVETVDVKILRRAQ